MIDAIFARLSESFSTFEVRPAQKEMMLDVSEAFASEQVLLIEAGTGTGKSLAYLIPALLWAQEKGERVVISTHTIALQEQLIHKDIPHIVNIFDLKLKVCLVKGMQHYVCLRKFHDSEENLPDFLSDWIAKTSNGTRTSLPLALSNTHWDLIEADKESCSQARCPFFKECFFFKARKEAQDAQVLVANHHLLFADLSIRSEEDNFTEDAILPAYGRLIIDEAHHIEEVATEHFASRITQGSMTRFLNRLLADQGIGKLQSLHSRILKFFPGESRRQEATAILDQIDIDLVFQKRKLSQVLARMFGILHDFVKERNPEGKLRLRDKEIEDPAWVNTVKLQVQEAVEIGRSWLQTVNSLEQQVIALNINTKEQEIESLFLDIRANVRRLESAFNFLLHFASSPEEKNRVRWIEQEDNNTQLIIADLEIAPKLSDSLFSHFATVVMCSATLATNQQFAYVKKRLGIPEETQGKIYPSPFDYQKQALLSIPTHLPDPTDANFVKEASEHIWEASQITRGQMFVLFTSYSMLQACQQILQDRLQAAGFSFLCHGQGERAHLLEQFRLKNQPILFGTDSFWEGIDVPLRCVIIVKLPFKVPSDPLFQARSEATREAGGSPFYDFALPQAVMKFKQGFGRLIRNNKDRGCIICLDHRLLKKGYGKQFLKNLPSCPIHTADHSAWSQGLHDFFRENLLPPAIRTNLC